MEQISTQPGIYYQPAQDTAAQHSRPVIFIHGMWGWHWCFSHFVQSFSAAGYPVYALDMVGHGPTTRQDPPPGNLPIKEYVRQMEQAIQVISHRHPGTLPLVVGYSMGGLVAQKTLETTPASGLVLISSAAPRGILVLPTFRTLMILTKYIIKSFFKRMVIPCPKEVTYLAFHHMAGQELQLALERVVPEYSRAYRQVILGRIPVDACKINCPVIVLGGGEDRMVKQSSNKKLAKKYNAPLKIFDYASHWIVREEGWQEVCRYILEWAAQNKSIQEE